tara:strand:- start:300 stop:719 length:420 start_codon:yes stop_codon:yes gene_type:complete
MAQGRSSFFIMILLSLITSISSLKANDDAMGLGIGTTSCADFLKGTIEIRDDGELTDLALFKRIEYLQWANGFMTALNIRHYEKNNIFKNMNSIKKFKDLYTEIVDSCYYIIKQGKSDEFSVATFLVFDSLGKASYQQY